MANFLVPKDLGFIGSHFTEKLDYACLDVTVLDHSNCHQNNLSHLEKKTMYIYNVEQIKSTIFSKIFDIIFHLATALDLQVLLILFKVLRLGLKQ